MKAKYLNNEKLKKQSVKKAVIEALAAISSKENNKLEGLIIGGKIDPNYKFTARDYLIDFALKERNVEALRILFENGASLQPVPRKFFTPCYRAEMWMKLLYSGGSKIDINVAKDILALYSNKKYCGDRPFASSVYVNLFLGTIRDAVKDTGLHKKYNIELGSKDIDDLLAFIDEKDKAAKKTDSTKVKKHKHSCCSIF